MKLKFWGTRGSIPVPGKDTLNYGGNTPCVEIRTKNNKLIALDAGSGLRELGKSLPEGNNEIDIFISHYHWDHIQGIPFFKPLYNKTNRITFHGGTTGGLKVENLLSSQMGINFFPIKIEDVNAQIKYSEVKANKSYKIDNVIVETMLAKHPSPTMIYKITEENKSIVYVTDNELNLDPSKKESSIEEIKELNKEIIDFCRGCEYLIHDTMYDEASVRTKKGWGHSSNITLAYLGMSAEVKNIVLFHYNPDYSDAMIEKLLNETQKVLSKSNSKTKCIGAREKMEINL
jgi:phosphoribosyl 1,2-cyclic phosphodiesterase